MIFSFNMPRFFNIDSFQEANPHLRVRVRIRPHLPCDIVVCTVKAAKKRKKS